MEVKCTLYRAGTSKVVFFLKDELPSDESQRDRLLLKIMGSEDQTQISGLGGGTSITSKVGIVSLSHREDVDVDFNFLQIGIASNTIGKDLNCGNAISAVASFAIENNLIPAGEDNSKTVTVYNENTKKINLVTVEIKNRAVQYAGDTNISGVNENGSPIRVSFKTTASRDQLLPTGAAVDSIAGIHVSCVNYITPMVIIKANDFFVQSGKKIASDSQMMSRLEEIRLIAGRKMGMGDVAGSVSPKLCVVSEPANGGDITSYYFTPWELHRAHAVSGALCLCAAMHTKGSIVFNDGQTGNVRIEHPSGFIDVSIIMVKQGMDNTIQQGSCIRTARPIMKGVAVTN